MPYELIQEVELYNEQYQRYLRDKEQTEGDLHVQLTRKKMLDNFINNINDIEQLIKNINDILQDGVDDAGDCPSLRIGAITLNVFVTHNVESALSRINESVRYSSERLAYYNEKLASMGPQTAVKLVLKDIRKMLNTRRYVGSGSVKLLKAGNGDYYLKFAMQGVRVQPHKTFSELREKFPNKPWLSAVEGADDCPSVLLPRIIFTVNLRNKEVTITRGRDKNPVKFNGHPHPHYQGGICLGSFTEAFTEAVDDHDISSIVGVLRSWAGVATVYEDAWGTYFFKAYGDMVRTVLQGGYHYISSVDGRLNCHMDCVSYPLRFVEHINQPGAYDIILGAVDDHEEKRYVFNPYEL